VHVDHVVELEEQLAVGARPDFRGAKPVEDFREQRRPGEHVELERKDVGAVHLYLVYPGVLGPVTM
jgi:hypothetical protein